MPRKSEAARSKSREYSRAWWKEKGHAYRAKRLTPRNGRGECPRCKGMYALRIDGEVRSHTCVLPPAEQVEAERDG